MFEGRELAGEDGMGVSIRVVKAVKPKAKAVVTEEVLDFWRLEAEKDEARKQKKEREAAERIEMEKKERAAAPQRAAEAVSKAWARVKQEQDAYLEAYVEKTLGKYDNAKKILDTHERIRDATLAMTTAAEETRRLDGKVRKCVAIGNGYESSQLLMAAIGERSVAEADFKKAEREWAEAKAEAKALKVTDAAVMLALEEVEAVEKIYVSDSWEGTLELAGRVLAALPEEEQYYPEEAMARVQEAEAELARVMALPVVKPAPSEESTLRRIQEYEEGLADLRSAPLTDELSWGDRAYCLDVGTRHLNTLRASLGLATSKKDACQLRIDKVMSDWEAVKDLPVAAVAVAAPAPVAAVVEAPVKTYFKPTVVDVTSDRDTLRMGDLPFDVQWSDLKALFDGIGVPFANKGCVIARDRNLPILTVDPKIRLRVPKRPTPWDDYTKSPKGGAFIKFDSHLQARRAIERLTESGIHMRCSYMGIMKNPKIEWAITNMAVRR